MTSTSSTCARVDDVSHFSMRLIGRDLGMSEVRPIWYPGVSDCLRSRRCRSVADETASSLDWPGELVDQSLRSSRGEAADLGGCVNHVRPRSTEADGTFRRGVYGLFADAGPAGAFHWELVGDIPANLAITAVASTTGHLVWVGTAGGRIFALDSSRITAPLETPAAAPNPPAGTAAAPVAVWIMRIAITREGVAAATLTADYGNNIFLTDVLRLDGLNWTYAGVETNTWYPQLGQGHVRARDRASGTRRRYLGVHRQPALRHRQRRHNLAHRLRRPARPAPG